MMLLVLLLEMAVQVMALGKMEAKCGQNVYLPCNADFKGRDYFSVTWYKEEKIGLIRKSLTTMQEMVYDFPRDVSLNEENSLVLTKVTSADSGKYECAVSARVGGQNINLFVELAVAECEPEETTVSITTLDTKVTARP